MTLNSSPSKAPNRESSPTCVHCGKVLEVGQWPFCPHERIEPRAAHVQEPINPEFAKSLEDW